jgi:integrase
VSEELVPPAVYEALRTVAGLTFGRTAARETEPVRPVSDEHVEAVLPYVTPVVATIIQLQRLTGMRPDEAVRLRMCEVDTSNPVWIYEPYAHKNRWRAHRRFILIGPKAQQLLAPFLNREPSEFVFSPKESEAIRNGIRKQNRKSPMTPSQASRRPKKHPKNAKRAHYDVDSYRRAITYGIRKANRNGLTVPHWAPNQLRHSRATEIRKKFGVEAAQVVLGHARADVTQIYAERNLDLAITVTQQSG